MDAVSGNRGVHSRLRLPLPRRLPNLKGIWLTAYSIVWIAVLAIASFAIIRGAYIELTVPKKFQWSPYGFTTSLDNSGFHVAALGTAAARESGLAIGDDIVALDDWVIPHTDTAHLLVEEHLVKPYGTATTFTLRKPDGELYKVRLTRTIEAEEQWYRDAGLSRQAYKLAFLVPGLSFALLFLAAAILLFVRRRREAVPALLSLGFLMIAPVAFDSAWNAWNELGVGVIAITYFAATGWMLVFAAFLAFPSGRLEPRWTAVCLVLLPLMLLLVLAPGNALGTATFSLIFLISLAALVSRYRKVSDGAERQQLRWVFFGFGAGGIIVVASLIAGIAIQAVFGRDPRWSALSIAGNMMFSIGLMTMAGGLIVSILRYRLYDADAVIGRSATYAVLTLGFVSLFAASQKIIELLGEEYFGQNVGALAGGVGAALAALAIAPMHARVQRWAQRRFQRALHRLRYGLPALVSDLRETSGIESIVGATLDNVVAGMQARAAALIVGTSLSDARGLAAEEVQAWLAGWNPPAHDGLDCDRSDPVFPLRVPLEAEGHGRVGWLLVGPRPDGSFFGSTERNVIEDIAEPVARAVQVALMREDREANHAHRFNAIESRIESIERTLSKLLASRRPAGEQGL
jgi:hypothetical protein